MIISARYTITCETQREKDGFHPALADLVKAPQEGWNITSVHVNTSPCKHIVTMEYKPS